MMRCAIWYHLYNLKKREKHPWRSVNFSKVAGFKLQFDVIIVWIVNAKDNLHNCYGYSLNQLVYRHNPSLPSVLTNKLPVMEGSTSELLRSHFNAISDSRRVFIECEGNEELQRAIRSKLQRATCLIYGAGVHVFFKRNDSNQLVSGTNK